MQDVHPAHSTKRYLLVAVFVAVLAIFATILLTALVSAMGGEGVVSARLDSPRVHGAADEPHHSRHLTVAIAPVIASRGSDAAWEWLAEHLERDLDLEIGLMHRRTYAEIEELIQGREAVVALIGAGSYVRLRRDGAVQLLATPRIGGADVHHAHIIVPADSTARSLDDLRGDSFAFSDPLSTPGALYPRSLLAQRGETAEQFFSRTIYTFGHDRSIRAVSRGLVGGAAIDSLVYDAIAEADPDVARRVRIIHTSPPLGMHPVVANQRMSPELAAGLRAQLLAMQQTERGREILTALGIDELAPSNPAAYRSIEAMLDALER